MPKNAARLLKVGQLGGLLRTLSAPSVLNVYASLNNTWKMHAHFSSRNYWEPVLTTGTNKQIHITKISKLRFK